MKKEYYNYKRMDDVEAVKDDPDALLKLASTNRYTDAGMILMFGWTSGVMGGNLNRDDMGHSIPSVDIDARNHQHLNTRRIWKYGA